jgi:hypothetical protein
MGDPPPGPPTGSLFMNVTRSAVLVTVGAAMVIGAVSVESQVLFTDFNSGL